MDNIKEVLDKVDERNFIVDKYEYITKNVIPKQKDMFSIENIMCNNTLLCDACTHNPKNGGEGNCKHKYRNEIKKESNHETSTQSINMGRKS